MEKHDEVVSRTLHRKRFPIRCAHCGQVAVRPTVIPYEIEKNHDGKLHKLRIPELHVNKCDQCGSLYFSDDADDQITAALRAKLCLLTPDDIRSGIKRFGLNQKEFAERIGVAAESVSRWLNGAMVQSRLGDNAMRWFFGIPAVREATGISRLSGSEPERSHASSNIAVENEEAVVLMQIKVPGQFDAATIRRSNRFRLCAMGGSNSRH